MKVGVRVRIDFREARLPASSLSGVLGFVANEDYSHFFKFGAQDPTMATNEGSLWHVTRRF